MKIAVEGCCHGELENIYDQIASLEHKHAYKVDVLLICGDFQAVRNHHDLMCMAVPQKYRKLGGFHEYYVGEKVAPILTIVIGGNHEASNYLWELYHGGWLAPNIYFLGFSGCVRVNGVRIAGSSGIYKSGDYNHGHYERLPYDQSSLRSIYHVRKYDVSKLTQLSSPTIFLSHDWPNTIERHGNTGELLRRKPFFRKDVEASLLGSPPMLELLEKLKPQWWFSAHLHVKFEALYRHGVPNHKTMPIQNPDEIIIEDVDDDGPMKPTIPNPDEVSINENDILQANESSETHFMALDKCLPRREFLDVVDIPVEEGFREVDSPCMTFDPEWLAITRAFHPFLSTAREQVPLPEPKEAQELVAKELAWVHENVPERGLQKISDVQKFWRTAPGPSMPGSARISQPPWYTNPQTEALAQMLQITNKINPIPPGASPPMVQGAAPLQAMTNNEVPEAVESSEVDVSGGWSPSRIMS